MQQLVFGGYDRVTDQLRTATETIQLLTSDTGKKEDFTDVAPLLHLTLIKVRNLIDHLQQHRNEMSDFSVKGHIVTHLIQEGPNYPPLSFYCTWYIPALGIQSPNL